MWLFDDGSVRAIERSNKVRSISLLLANYVVAEVGNLTHFFPKMSKSSPHAQRPPRGGGVVNIDRCITSEFALTLHCHQ